MASSSNEGETSSKSVDKDIHKSNGLLLYSNKHSFYSQKVIMALYEKKVQFKTKSVDLLQGEQFHPWFIEMNPLCQVPILKDEGKIIPDSSRIIDYLEDNLSNGQPRLVPNDQGSEVKVKVIQYRDLLDEVPIGLLTKGSFFHPEFLKNTMPPFVGAYRTKFHESFLKKAEALRGLATSDSNSNIKEILLGKAEKHEEELAKCMDKELYKSTLDDVDLVLDEIEKELFSHDEMDDWWLCSDRFTVADISLSLLLHRLNSIGLSHRFWGNGKRPLLENYFNRVTQRESFIKTIPSLQSPPSLDLSSQLLVGSVVFLVVVTIFFYFKRKSK
nr:PREDICTED: ganglioside-induced differentiation-associated protein 1 [Bemisia tabaci]